jgi:hypothetical protein
MVILYLALQLRLTAICYLALQPHLTMIFYLAMRLHLTRIFYSALRPCLTEIFYRPCGPTSWQYFIRPCSRTSQQYQCFLCLEARTNVFFASWRFFLLMAIFDLFSLPCGDLPHGMLYLSGLSLHCSNKYSISLVAAPHGLTYLFGLTAVLIRHSYPHSASSPHLSGQYHHLFDLTAAPLRQYQMGQSSSSTAPAGFW